MIALFRPQASLVRAWTAGGLPPSHASVGGPSGGAFSEQAQNPALRASRLFAARSRPQASLVRVWVAKSPCDAGAFVLCSGWAVRDSNPRPPRCKRGALNQLS